MLETRIEGGFPKADSDGRAKLPPRELVEERNRAAVTACKSGGRCLPALLASFGDGTHRGDEASAQLCPPGRDEVPASEQPPKVLSECWSVRKLVSDASAARQDCGRGKVTACEASADLALWLDPARGLLDSAPLEHRTRKLEHVVSLADFLQRRFAERGGRTRRAFSRAVDEHDGGPARRKRMAAHWGGSRLARPTSDPAPELRVRVGHVSAGVDPGAAARAVGSLEGRFDQCFAAARATAPWLEGAVELRLTLDGTGHAWKFERTRVSLPDVTAVSCMEDAAHDLEVASRPGVVMDVVLEAAPK